MLRFRQLGSGYYSTQFISYTDMTVYLELYIEISSTPNKMSVSPCFGLLIK